MRVVRARVDPYTLPLKHPWSTATGAPRQRPGFLLRLQDDAGRVAQGDAAPLPNATKGGPVTIGRALERLAALVEEQTPDATLDSPPGTDLDGPVRHAWSQAVLTLHALERAEPLRAALSRLHDARLPRVASVPVNAALPLAREAETVAAARAAVKAGYACLKLKSRNALGEADRVAAVRAAVGTGVRLRVDANGSWDPATAARLLAELAPLDIDYVEQPLPPGRLPALARLHAGTTIPLAIDESAQNPAQARALIERGIVDVLVVKPMAIGGLDRALSLVRFARERGTRVIVTDSVESAVGRTAALHLASLLGPDAEPCGLASGDHVVRDVVAHPPRVQRGRLTVPTRPGLGLADARP